jgi:genome maintenance exonuclease 1
LQKPFKELSAAFVNGRRIYTTPDGNKYPSITTVLGATSDKSGLDEWRARVGEEVANKIMREAADNGTAMHDMLECYLLKEEYQGGATPLAVKMYEVGTRVADKFITKVVQTEAPLYSNKLRVAGRTDLIAFWENELAICDWKNRGTKEFKHESEVGDYRLQICFYAQAVHEITGRPPKLGVIISLNCFTRNIIKFDPLEESLKQELQHRIDTYYRDYT